MKLFFALLILVIAVVDLGSAKRAKKVGKKKPKQPECDTTTDEVAIDNCRITQCARTANGGRKKVDAQLKNMESAELRITDGDDCGTFKFLCTSFLNIGVISRERFDYICDVDEGH